MAEKSKTDGLSPSPAHMCETHNGVDAGAAALTASPFLDDGGLMPEPPSVALPLAGQNDKKTPEKTVKKPHYHGHRERLRARFRTHGAESLPDYELLELLLFRAIPMRDIKPLAKQLLAHFGSFADVLAASPSRLSEINGLGDGAITELKLIEAAAKRMTRVTLLKRPSLNSWSELIDYCHTHMAFLDHEEFRLLFLDKKNHLIADERQSEGTVDHTPVYPREIVKRALELGATALILVHNHPSGDPAPSAADVKMTKEIALIAKPLGIHVHDHVIVGRNGHTSLKGLKLLG